MDYVIGIDIGTQSTKALLCDARGNIVAQHASSYHPDTPRPLWAEQWPAVWLDAVMEAIAACVTKTGAATADFAPSHVRALCVSSLYGGSGIPVDDRIKPLHPCLIWMDRRATAEVDWVCANLDLERLYDITGNSVDSYYGFTKILWLKNNRPEVWSKTRYLLPPNAFVIHALTGEIAVDHSSAGNIGGVYDLKERTWSGEMLDRLGIPRRMMPERLVASSEVVAGLTAQAAGQLGLITGLPVIAGGVDAAMATLAAGVTSPGQHVAMIGSSMCWGFIAHDTDARRGLVCMPAVFGEAIDKYVFGGAITAGAAITWFHDNFCRAIASDAEESDADLHDLLESGARTIAAGAEGVQFLPYLMGERSPIWDSKASGAFVGLSLYHTRYHLYRAVLEGVSFALRHNIEAGLKGGVVIDDQLIVVGGAAHSDLWMQIIADVTGRPVVTIAQEVEAAMGSALLAAYGVSLIKAEDVRRGWAVLVPRAKPDPLAVQRYNHLFDVYTALYPTLKKQMHTLNDLAVEARKIV
jgi:ribulokinase